MGSATSQLSLNVLSKCNKKRPWLYWKDHTWIKQSELLFKNIWLQYIFKPWVLKLSKVLLLSGSEVCSRWAHVHPAASQFNTEQVSVRSEDKALRIPLMTSSTQDKSRTRRSGGDSADSLDVCRSFSLLTSVSGICPVKASALPPSGTLAHVCRSGTAWAWSTHCKKCPL